MYLWVGDALIEMLAEAAAMPGPPESEQAWRGAYATQIASSEMGGS